MYKIDKLKKNKTTTTGNIKNLLEYTVVWRLITEQGMCW